MEVDSESDVQEGTNEREWSLEIPTPGELDAGREGTMGSAVAEDGDQVLEPPESEEESSAGELADEGREGQDDGEEEWQTMAGQLVPPPRRKEPLEVVLPTVKQLRQGELCWISIMSA